MPKTKKKIAADNLQIDVHRVLETRKQVAVIWSLDDVQQTRPDLNDDQSWQVLQRCIHAHDCNYGFSWDLISFVADSLFPEGLT
jgi:hypothetical protein